MLKLETVKTIIRLHFDRFLIAKFYIKKPTNFLTKQKLYQTSQLPAIHRFIHYLNDINRSHLSAS